MYWFYVLQCTNCCSQRTEKSLSWSALLCGVSVGGDWEDIAVNFVSLIRLFVFFFVAFVLFWTGARMNKFNSLKAWIYPLKKEKTTKHSKYYLGRLRKLTQKCSPIQLNCQKFGELYMYFEQVVCICVFRLIGWKFPLKLSKTSTGWNKWHGVSAAKGTKHFNIIIHTRVGWLLSFGQDKDYGKCHAA